MYFVWNIIMAYMVSTMTNSEPMKNGYGFVQEWVMPDNGNVTIKSVDQTSIFRETQVEGGRLCLFTLLEIRCIWIYIYIYIYIYTLTLRYPSFLGSFQNRLFFGVVPFFWGRLPKKDPFPLAMSICSLNPAGSKSRQKLWDCLSPAEASQLLDLEWAADPQSWFVCTKKVFIKYLSMVRNVTEEAWQCLDKRACRPTKSSSASQLSTAGDSAGELPCCSRCRRKSTP